MTVAELKERLSEMPDWLEVEITDDSDVRVELLTLGQVTWPEPELNQKCHVFRFFNQSDQTKAAKAEGLGRCQMVSNVSNGKKKGVTFDGRTAIACSVFEARG